MYMHLDLHQYDRHKLLVNNYLQYYGGNKEMLKRDR